MANDKGQILLYQTPDGESRIEVRLQDETVWLNLDQMAELFQRNKSTISRHIKNVFEEGELQPEATVAKFATVVNRGIRGEVEDRIVFYNLDMIISVGSIDYDPRVEMTQEFFKTVQNKMHYSVHGHTAAEIIYERADAQKDFMGLTTWTGAMPKRTDAEIAKNYLSQEEVTTLNRIVSLYLDFAELQAEEHRPMYMKDWIAILDDFLRISRKDILTHAGRVSAQLAKAKADAEYDKFKERTKNELSAVEIHFLEQFEREQKKLTEKKDKR